MCENIIEVRNLTRRFRRVTALDDVSLSVPRGVVLGLVGENGAGKTTLIKHLLGLLDAKSGSVSVFGVNPVKDPVGALSRVGFLSENREMPEWMRIGELMRYQQGFFPAWDEAFANELLDAFELDPQARVKNLSRGQRARTGLLIAVAHRPDLLLLDEPSSGLDAVVRRDILGQIVRTVAEEGRTVIFSSHILEEVQRVADRVAVMHRGKLVLDDRLDTIIESHRHLTLRFDEPLSEAPRLPGMLGCSGDGREWSCVCNGALEQLRKDVQTRQAKIVEERAATLEEIFVARVKGSPVA